MTDIVESALSFSATAHAATRSAQRHELLGREVANESLTRVDAETEDDRIGQHVPGGNGRIVEEVHERVPELGGTEPTNHLRALDVALRSREKSARIGLIAGSSGIRRISSVGSTAPGVIDHAGTPDPQHG